MVTTHHAATPGTIDDWNRDLAPGQTYTFDRMHFPYPMTPLSASTMGPAFADGATAGFHELQLPLDAITVVHRNHYRFERWDMVEPASMEEAQRLGEVAEGSLQVEVGRMMERWHGEHLPRIAAHLRRLDEMKLAVATASPAALSRLLNEAQAIHEDLWHTHFLIVLPMMLSMQLFDELHADLFGGDESAGHALLVGGLSESVKAGIGLSELAVNARRIGLTGVIGESAPDALVSMLEASEEGRAFLAELDRYLDVYGYRQDLFEYATLTWKEDPSFALASIRNYIQTGRDARAEQEAIARSAEAALTGARERLAGYPEAVRGQFEAMVQFARQGAFLQEEHNFYIDQQGTARLRLLYQAVGKRFVDAGLIDSAEDVFTFTIDEVQEHLIDLADVIASDRLRWLVAERRSELAFVATISPPPFIGTPPAGPPPMGNPMERAMVRFFGGPPQAAADASQIKGNAGSKGTATGIARVARTLDEARHLQPGEILVAVTTMPAWTPLFGLAAAVVTETGGPLSHCAIVAREYGIPAVVGATGVTQRIVTGQRISVDGATGVITLLE